MFKSDRSALGALLLLACTATVLPVAGMAPAGLLPDLALGPWYWLFLGALWSVLLAGPLRALQGLVARLVLAQRVRRDAKSAVGSLHQALIGAAVAASSDAFMVVSPAREVVYANAAFRSGREATGPARLPAILLEDPPGRGTQRSLWDYLDDGLAQWSGEALVEMGSGVFAERRVSATRVAGGYLVVGILDNVTARAYRERLEFMASHDALTELLNRPGFEMRLAARMAEQAPGRRRGFGVIQLDLDHFSAINDSLGHEIGDRLLQAVGARIARRLRGGDCLARFGGDEFCMLIDAAEDGDALESAAREIQSVFDAPFMLDGVEVFCRASLGLVHAPLDGASAQDLIKYADSAMNRVKRGGRGGLERFSREINEQAVRRLRLATELRLALRDQQFCLHFQPAIDARTGSICAFEALVRWNHPVDGMISPAEFIPIAEETGVINELGDWVFREAAAALGRWDAAGGARVGVSVNLSARQLLQPDIAMRLAESARAAGIAPRRLTLEITETALMRDPEFAASQVRRLKRRGFPIALDDFGTGYSSLSYLKHFRIDQLKIDRSFVRGLPGDRDDIAITRTIVAMARHLGLAIVAEGVETAAQAAYLRELGCEMLQGFHFSRPLPEAAALACLREDALALAG
ncbi:diguanylate cyclase (GGDEF)-like protein [Natronocella acetinitrilica]|uniref:cyclic-guanylate-specific phosphodiesterase n=1 Tax=Natronocella acetinitrilica TaxID=414046 RepID=A0AAE3G2S8_9GAMM|nr:bifunctional diguanylate cyclase/phosphodiesterase [Natronocella acetinitrilica]MCP1674108.1 diguanylate cyclase (GGDEF)-like protein [Natronocella acetinitrilica]